MPANTAAWINKPFQKPLEVRSAPYPELRSQDIIVQNVAVAFNPLDYMLQDTNPKLGGKEIEYPTILGADAAGTVVEVGSNASRFSVGDRIIANVSGLGKESSAFQQYLRVPEDHAIKLPSSLPFEKAVVLPLATDTATAGLFVPDRLGLSTAVLADSSAKSSQEIVIVWGGSSSVGSCAIQLAKAAGYTVFTTASKRNHDLCQSLGASHVFDHSSADVEEEMIAAMQGKQVIGALDCIANEKTIASCVKILSKATGQKKVVTVLTPPDLAAKDGVEVQRLSIPALLGSSTYTTVHSWIEKALASGVLQTKPDAKVIGNGLESVQSGIDAVKAGVSATKIVVTL